jgi:cytochrome P450
MDRRLDALLSLDRMENASAARRAWMSVQSWTRMLRFYWMDVRPAIAAHRRTPQEDVIGHLLEHEYNDMEVLIECITYGAAGMATTREFLCMAAWHLLEDDALRAEYLAADEAERHRILQEILRLEPVVGKLYRRTTEPLRVEVDGATHEIPAGALVELDVRAANADVAAVGEDPLAVCPHRDLAPGVLPPVMSFGDGVHRCPGAYIAIQETDVFLTRLLRLELRVARPPRLAWNELIESYEVRGFEVEVVGARGDESRPSDRNLSSGLGRANVRA